MIYNCILYRLSPLAAKFARLMQITAMTTRFFIIHSLDNVIDFSIHSVIQDGHYYNRLKLL